MNEYTDINTHENYPNSNEHLKVPTMKVIPLKKICMTIGELPTAYVETMTYYEMLIWFINYLRDNIIPVVNGNGEAVQELQNVVMSLQNYINEFKDSIDEDVENLEEYMNNYFENLDVQAEVNAKLDEMAQEGYFDTIIAQYISGFGLNVKTFGATGDGETDDTQAFLDCIAYAKQYEIGTINIPDGEYVISDTLEIDFSNVEIKGFSNSKLLYQGEGTTGYIIRAYGEDDEHYIENIKIHDITIDATGQEYKGGASMETPLVTHTNPLYKGLTGIRVSYAGNVKIYNCKLNDIYGGGIVTSRCFSVKINDNVLRDCSGGNPRGGDNFGDGITAFGCWDVEFSNNSVINKRVYLASTNANDIGTICGRSGLEFEYGLYRDELYTPQYDNFYTLEGNGLRMENNYVYGYTKGSHFESNVISTIVGNTFIHNYIGLLSSTDGKMNITGNQFDNDNVGDAIQSGYDAYSGCLAITQYTSGILYGEFNVSNNVFKGTKRGITIGKSRINITNNTFYITPDNEGVAHAIHTVTAKCSEIVLSNNTLYNCSIYGYQPIRWLIDNNVIYNTTKQTIIFTGNSSENKIQNNIIYNSIYCNGTQTDSIISNNQFVSSSDIETLAQDNSFIKFTSCSHMDLCNNDFDLTNNDTCYGVVLSSTSNNIKISNNTIKATTNRTTQIFNITVEVRGFEISGNKIFGLSNLAYFVRHSWNVNRYFINKNNISDNPLAYIYYQSSGSNNGKNYIEGNNGKTKYNQTPNASLSKFNDLMFNKGERIFKFDGTGGWSCTREGYYTNNSWAENTTYAVGKLIVSNDYVYKCEVAGTSTTAPTGTTLGDIETTADDLQWLCCGQIATFSNI